MQTQATEPSPRANAGAAQTPDLYGHDYQQRQADKYRNRASNHWGTRIDLAFDLAKRHALPRLEGRDPATITVLDVGCSIGTFAIEFAKRGYNAIGVDFDPDALATARQLAEEEGANPTFIQGDIADLRDEIGEVDIAICFDIFEHLMDDELGVLLHTIRRSLSPQGTLLFHTFPTQHHYLFYAQEWQTPRALGPFANLPPEQFEQLTRVWESLYDAFLLMTMGDTHRDHITPAAHCNPLSRPRLEGILKRAGFTIDLLDSAELYTTSSKTQIADTFAHQPITHRNLFGVAHATRP